MSLRAVCNVVYVGPVFQAGGLIAGAESARSPVEDGPAHAVFPPASNTGGKWSPRLHGKCDAHDAHVSDNAHKPPGVCCKPNATSVPRRSTRKMASKPNAVLWAPLETTMSMPQELLSIRKVSDRISFSKSWIYAEMKAGRFPKPLELGFGKNLWTAASIDAWISAQLQKAA